MNFNGINEKLNINIEIIEKEDKLKIGNIINRK